MSRPHLVGARAIFPMLLLAASWAVEAAGDVDFDRDVRPILSDRCFQCHGPDENQRQAELRLDVEDGLFDDRGGYRVVVPGDPDKSELYRRITGDDGERMPPADSGKPLTGEKIRIIRNWIEQGAKWQRHWSFIAPKRPPVPAVASDAWPQNPIDNFILARLRAEGLSPSASAAKTTLIRRVTLDLTGLPPTPEEVTAFLHDGSLDAYEKVVDRLLESPHYGEQMAVRWLDAARYADTSGYQNDGPRSMWRWRDWIIDAYNRNLPFDQFTVEQIAGDMLPDATLEQTIATGFNRNHRGNSEGGVIPEEFAVEYVVDRVDTTFTVWLGLTMGCARCHDHKFDPFSQKEFYRVFAYFNNVPEHGRAIKEGNSPPYIKAPTAAQRAQLNSLDEKLAQAERRFQQLQPELAAAEMEWASSAAASHAGAWTYAEGLLARFRFDGDASDDTGRSEAANFESDEANYSAGRLGKSALLAGQGFVDAGDVGEFGYFDKFSLAAWIRTADGGGGTIVSRMSDVRHGDGYSVQLLDGRVHVNLVKRWLDDAIRVKTDRRLIAHQWHHVAVTYDGSRVAAGIKVYVDGREEPLEVELDAINQSFQSPEPLRIGGGGGSQGRFRGLIDDVRIYGKCLSAREAELISVPDSIQEILDLEPEKRSPAQGRKLRAYFLALRAPDAIRGAHRRVVDLRARRQRYFESIPTVMVMLEMTPPRETRVLRRGQYDEPGDKVTPGVPSALAPFPAGVENNRLGLAKWLVHRSNPLTARVAVNRYWQMCFGEGIVRTMEDFGVQGERPSHPELLDWLATEFVRTGWDVKSLLRLIVTSSTYRQSSMALSYVLARDPENRLLARAPRFRLPAETIRDQALAVGGLLVDRLGGPSVKPYQPAGLWKEIASTTNYDQSRGDDLYRRSLYTYWKRTVAPPTITIFDAPSRESCVVRRSRTNTPLQALTLLNDVTFTEAARRLAERVMLEGGERAEQRIAYAFQLATARRPAERELTVVLRGHRQRLARFRENGEAAQRLVSVGDSATNANLDPVELAAYTTTCSVVLNLDEVLMRD